MKRLRIVLAWMMLLVMLLPSACAEVPLMHHATGWDLTQTPVEVTLTASVLTHMPFDDERLSMLQEVLSPLSLSLYAAQEESGVSVRMNGASLLTLAQKGDQVQLSCMPGVTYTSQDGSALTWLLGAELETPDLGAVDGTTEKWLDDGWTVLTGILEPFESYGKRKSVKTTVKDMGLARSCTDYTVSKSHLDEMKQTLLSLCPEGELRELLSSLVFSGSQKLRVYRTEDDVPLRMEYNGVCGREGDLRTVKLVWRMKREANEMRDEVTLTSPAKSGTNKNTLSFSRIVKITSGKITVSGDYSWKVTANKKTSLTEATFDLSNQYTQAADVLRGSVVITVQPDTSEKAKTTTTISPSLVIGGTQEDPTVQGTISYQEANTIGTTENCEITVSLRRMEGSLWQEGTTLVDLATLTAEEKATQQARVGGAVTTAIVRPLMQLLGAEKGAYFFKDMAEEDVEEILTVVESAVEVE